MDKNAIKKYATWARRELISRVSQKAAYYEITEEHPGKVGEAHIGGRVLTAVEKNQRDALIRRIQREGYEQVMEEVAYTWFNRFCALRYMEVNNYLPTHIRVFTDEEGAFKPQILTEAINLELDGLDMEKVYAYKDANEQEQLYRYLLITQCNALSSILPGMFQKIEDYTELLLPENLLREGSVIEQMVMLIPEEDWTDQVQIIGWLYQCYIAEKHDEIVNIYKGTVKQKDIPAATQLFTTDWVVRYMVDNSLGRYWIERHPESDLADKLVFFVKPKNGKISHINEKVEPQELTFFDPCMGSGHILVYAFDVLMEIYEECGYTQRDAAQEIIKNNLHGLDIDERCSQLAYFSVMMKARSCDRRFFSRHIQPQVYYAQKDEELIAYGSLVTVPALKEMPPEPTEGTLFDEDLKIALKDWNCRRLLSQKYAVVCTNPPYLNKYNSDLKKFVTDHYKAYSGDLFSVFMYRNFGFCKEDGYTAFMSPFVWMFIKTYKNLRRFIIENKKITTLIQMEYSAFEEATVPICTFVLKNGKGEEPSLCFRLSDFKGGMEVQKNKVLEAIANPSCGYFYEAQQSNFAKIPGSPVAYWLGDTVYKFYTTGVLLKNIIASQVGSTLGNNDLYLRLWSEVDCTNKEKWFFSHKGGSFRKWYGNVSHVVNWENDGFEVKRSGRATIRCEKNVFKEGIAWTQLTAGKPSFRVKNEGTFVESASCMCSISNEYRLYLLGLLNSKVSTFILGAMNPTMHYQPGDIGRMPWIYVESKKDAINSTVNENIYISKTDWDAFETSWDFQCHPLISVIPKNRLFFDDISSIDLSECYMCWELECRNRFDQLKANEEELNHIFIDIYGLQDELTPEVEDKDVTVRLADKTREVKSLISYAVGCMFGRYSLDREGLIYAGGEWDEGRYKTYPADKDNIIPICDDEYFQDDIVGRFVDFIRAVYGKDTLDENLKFIADALGGKGQPREVIRNYFLNDFYADHLKIYQKRPIYWLFDSGRKNGFKCLIYMHRYRPDTIARIRTDYVHEQQARYRTAIADLEHRIAGAPTDQRVKLNKQLTKLQAQADELREYEEKIHHLADQMIAIDLDDGVKKNYAIFQDVLAKIK